MELVLTYAAISEQFADTGLRLRGGCVWQGKTVILLGNAGPELWAHFASERRDELNPLDRWSQRLVEPIAQKLGGLAVFPSDQPFQPFIAWARAAEPVHGSPLGMLIHPEYGLWHAYRAALLFDRPVDGVPKRLEQVSPCETCADKPCLSACPVSAFSGAAYDVAACAGHLALQAEPACQSLGCRARAACPIGSDWRYPTAQIAFHMNAFAAARQGSGENLAEQR
jgi:hypothetical protein